MRKEEREYLLKVAEIRQDEDLAKFVREGGEVVHDKELSRMIKLILNKVKYDEKSKGYTATLTRKRDGEAFIVYCRGCNFNSDTWFLYEGCELVVGDTIIENIAGNLLREFA